VAVTLAGTAVRNILAGVTAHTTGAIANVALHETLGYFWMDRTSGLVLTGVTDDSAIAYTERSTLTVGTADTKLYFREDVAADASLAIVGTTSASGNSQVIGARFASDVGGTTYPYYHAAATPARGEPIDGTNDTVHTSNAVTVTAATSLIVCAMSCGNAQATTPTARLYVDGVDTAAATVVPAGAAGVRVFLIYASATGAADYHFVVTVPSTSQSTMHVVALTDEAATDPPPLITSIDGDDSLEQTDVAVPIVGTDFDTATVTFEQTGGVSVGQAIGSQSATLITLSSVTGFAEGGALKNGAATVRVTNADAQDDTHAFTLIPPVLGDISYVDLSTAAVSGQKLTAIPVLASGDQVEWTNVVGGSFVSTDVTVYDDHTVSWVNGVYQFDVRYYDNTAKEWSAWVTQTIDAIVSAGPTPAGKSRRKSARQYVEIDGQPFEVRSAQEAVELLNRARALAERESEVTARDAAKKVSRETKIKPVQVEAPQIKAPVEMRDELAPIIADIQRLYAKAAETAELRLLLQRQLDAEEEEELILLL
jgi:hypothetical protein